jgi:hypothetical protein
MLRQGRINRGLIAGFVLMAVAMPAVLVAQLGAGRGSGTGSGARHSTGQNEKPQLLITITKTDGTTVRGEIVSSDPDQIVFKPARKPSEKTDPEQINIPWGEIKRVSNGLTQQKALDAWKAQHVEQLCETCHGDRTVLCEVCKGTMHTPESAKDCPTCKGELLVDCKSPKCKDGIIPCPDKCLKLTEGNWVTKPDGLKWRIFRNSKGSKEWSEKNVGELVVLENGEWTNKGKCPTCGGKTELACPACHGVGKVPCSTCLARTDAPKCTNACDHGRTPCQACKGTGLKQ